MLGKTEHRLALVILLTAILPLASAMLLAYSLLNHASSVWLRPEVEQQLEGGIDLYKEYVRAVKDDMKHQTDAIAGDEALRDAARRRDAAACTRAIDLLFPKYPTLVSLAVGDAGATLAAGDRGRQIDESTERRLEVRRDLGSGGAGPTLVATFAFARRYEKELERAGAVHDAYAQLEKERVHVYVAYYEAFAALLGITVVATIALGFFFAGGITRRISRIANAINQVAGGNLEVRVPVTGSDEMTELARVFNRMLSEMQQSRARIEYLQRIGAWQEMAQRLAHEIKNPLTPIQLAVQECHRKYPGNDLRFRGLLNTTLEIVEEEVGTLRRLVGNFSSFARLPHVELHEANLRDFLRECSGQLGHLGAELAEDGAEELVLAHDVDVQWEVPDEAMAVAIDRQMLRRVLVNLVRNAVEAIRGGGPPVPLPPASSSSTSASPLAETGGPPSPRARVIVGAQQRGDGFAILVEDDGPGVPEHARERIFEPYFTTKVDGTGLGLAIVKKIVVEHNGAISVHQSERLRGAAFVVALPFPHSLAIAVTHGSGPSVGPPSARSSRRPAA